MDWSAVPRLTWENAYLGIVPALLGLVIALPLGIACTRWKWLYAPVLSATSVLYALPSLALFIVLIPYTGLTDTTVVIPLTLFSLCVLVPAVVDGMRSVPDPVRQAATAMGFGTTRRLVQVELPIAVPIVIAGLRIAVVSSISLASVGQLIGVSSLGYLIVDGYQRDFPEEIYVGGGLIIALALVCDLLLVALRRALTPWRPRRTRAEVKILAHGAAAARDGGCPMSFFSYAWNWIKQPQQWHGSGGIPVRILEQLGYTGLALLVAALIAVPLGILIGHTGRGAVLVVNVANAWRAIPTLGLLVLLAIWLGFSVLAWLVPLVVLGIPPILVNVYEGVAGVDPELKDAARGMGMTPWQQMRKVEVPVAMPLIVLGLRTGAIFVVATATIAAYIGLGGLGRYIIDGLAVSNYGEVAGGALFVVLLALAVQALFVGVRRVAVPAGLRQQERAS